MIDPAYSENIHPLVVVDEAHNNFHTSRGRYSPFKEVLERDGYIVEYSTQKYTKENLGKVDILVISNSLADRDLKRWELPAISAFDDQEISVIENWVLDGGSLFLIADHMPFPGAASSLASAFGVLFINGYENNTEDSPGRFLFTTSDSTLVDHPIIYGRKSSENVKSVMTFVGQGFRAATDVSPILILPSSIELLMPTRAGEFSEKTPHLSAQNLLQGATLRHGKGKVAVFGEAGMFTSQVVVRGKEILGETGTGIPEASENIQFLLNVMHWLSGLLPDQSI